jgi:hypothetical protein
MVPVQAAPGLYVLQAVAAGAVVVEACCPETASAKARVWCGDTWDLVVYSIAEGYVPASIWRERLLTADQAAAAMIYGN